MTSFAGQCDQVSLVKIVQQMTSFASQYDQPLAQSDQHGRYMVVLQSKYYVMMSFVNLQGVRSSFMFRSACHSIFSVATPTCIFV